MPRGYSERPTTPMNTAMVRGDHHPNGGNSPRHGQLTLSANGHEPQQDLGHAKVSQAPRQGGHHGEGPVGGPFPEEGRACRHLLHAIHGFRRGDAEELQEARDLAADVVNDRVQPPWPRWCPQTQ